jgi:hypothetical protein
VYGEQVGPARGGLGEGGGQDGVVAGTAFHRRHDRDARPDHRRGGVE